MKASADISSSVSNFLSFDAFADQSSSRMTPVFRSCINIWNKSFRTTLFFSRYSKFFRTVSIINSPTSLSVNRKRSHCANRGVNIHKLNRNIFNIVASKKRRPYFLKFAFGFSMQLTSIPNTTLAITFVANRANTSRISTISPDLAYGATWLSSTPQQSRIVSNIPLSFPVVNAGLNLALFDFHLSPLITNKLPDIGST